MCCLLVMNLIRLATHQVAQVVNDALSSSWELRKSSSGCHRWWAFKHVKKLTESPLLSSSFYISTDLTTKLIQHIYSPAQIYTTRQTTYSCFPLPDCEKMSEFLLEEYLYISFAHSHSDLLSYFIHHLPLIYLLRLYLPLIHLYLFIPFIIQLPIYIYVCVLAGGSLTYSRKWTRSWGQS